jgi:hypothetical protein
MSEPVPIGAGVSTGTGVGSGEEAEPSRLSVQLSEGKPQMQATGSLPVATGEPLSGERIEAILARLPDMPSQPETQSDFRLAAEPIPPPRPGDTVTEPFPPPPQVLPNSTSGDGPLEVLRYAPQGEIPIAPFVSVTFNQPMVLSLPEELSGQVPVRIGPSCSTWRWLGTGPRSEYD